MVGVQLALAEPEQLVQQVFRKAGPVQRALQLAVEQGVAKSAPVRGDAALRLRVPALCRVHLRVARQAWGQAAVAWADAAMAETAAGGERVPQVGQARGVPVHSGGWRLAARLKGSRPVPGQ